jgi:hypothetical protein
MSAPSPLRNQNIPRPCSFPGTASSSSRLALPCPLRSSRESYVWNNSLALQYRYASRHVKAAPIRDMGTTSTFIATATHFRNVGTTHKTTRCRAPVSVRQSPCESSTYTRHGRYVHLHCKPYTFPKRRYQSTTTTRCRAPISVR